jgi:hypothetical protein
MWTELHKLTSIWNKETGNNFSIITRSIEGEQACRVYQQQQAFVVSVSALPLRRRGR